MKRSASEQGLKYLGRATNPCGPCGFEASFKRQGKGKITLLKLFGPRVCAEFLSSLPFPFFPAGCHTLKVKIFF